MATNVPSLEFIETGVSAPAETDILNGVMADIDAAFGGGVNPSLTTPQGQLATSIAAIIGDKNDQITHIANQVNPDYADGAFQDAIGRIYFLERKAATNTTVTCQCVGEEGVYIHPGARAQDTSGNLYFCQDGGYIESSGTIDLVFTAQDSGPIPCPAGTLTIIYQTIPGWDTITNADAGAPGTDVEGRAEFEARRQASVAMNAHGSAAAIYGAVFNVDGVSDCYVTENVTSSTITAGATSYSLVAHSVYVAAVGGDDDEVAQAIWTKKDMGCSMNGNTTVTVYDDTYTDPKPSYSIKFHRPSSLPIRFAVSIVNKSTLPSNISALIKDAIISAFSGGDGGERARIAGTIYASRFYAPVALAHSSVSILSVQVGTSTANLTSVTAGIDQYPTIDPANITVTLT